MKRYLYTSVIALLTICFIACENDPITISYGTPIKVDPSGVIAPFTYEVKAGELESFSSSYKLRIRVLAYDVDGKLAAADTSFLTNYAGIMNTTLTLQEGTYTLIAITDVVRYSSGKTTLEYWILSGIQDINQTKITNAGYIGGKNKILGIDSKRISVSGESSTVNLAPSAAGALLCVRVLHMHQFTNVTEYKLLANRNADFLTFDSQGNAISTPQNDNNQFKWRVTYFNPQDEAYANYSGYYAYNFMFPVSNANYKFVYSTESETDEELATNMLVNLEKGDEYLFLLELFDEEDPNYDITYDYGKVNGTGTRTRSTELPQTPWMKKMAADAQNAAKLKDLIK